MLDQLEWQTDMVGKIAYIIDIEIHSERAFALCKSKFSSSWHKKIQKYHNWKYQNGNVVYFHRVTTCMPLLSILLMFEFTGLWIMKFKSIRSYKKGKWRQKLLTKTNWNILRQ